MCPVAAANRRTVGVAVLLNLCLLLGISRAQNSELPASGPSYEVHGRLSVYNGTPSFRIWIVGTKRILGVMEDDDLDVAMPKELLDILAEDINDRQVFADFKVTPCTTYERGVMQFVRIESARNVVVVRRDLTFIRRVIGVVERKGTAKTDESSADSCGKEDKTK